MNLPHAIVAAFRPRTRAHREAKLRPEFARLYPNLPANEWHPAMAVRCVVVNQCRFGHPRLPLPPRGLNEEHFEFRGSSISELRPGEDRRFPAALGAYRGGE
ncbi:MAG TPA: hypothetical protein VIG08_03535 [Gemmatimonadales bacterium]